MELFNLLEQTIPFFGQTFDVSLNWIGRLICMLVSGVGSVGVGVILFSLILRCVVLPCDVYQRISMRKQNQKMKEQKERMEKLQKQYANNEKLYNEKLMEMYKENGISLFSSCLPMILSMVIFFVAIGAFNDYSQYSAVQNYNALVEAFNTKIESYCGDLESANLTFEDNKIVVRSDAADDYLYYRLPAENYTEATDREELNAYIEACTKKEYLIDLDKVQAISEIEATEEKTYEEVAKDYFIQQAQAAVLETYENKVTNDTGFLWIKNVWATDATYVHPVFTWTEFKSKAQAEKYDVDGTKVELADLPTQVYTEDAYNLITGSLSEQKSSANGYYILILLSIGTILLQQFIIMRSQKEQNQFSTVDGQGASSQKMTMIMMTAMFAVFSFMYSAAFSLYMVVSNVFSMCATLIINKAVDLTLKKKSEKAETAKLDKRGLSRIEAAKNKGKELAKENREKKSAKEENVSTNAEVKTEEKIEEKSENEPENKPEE